MGEVYIIIYNIVLYYAGAGWCYIRNVVCEISFVIRFFYGVPLFVRGCSVYGGARGVVVQLFTGL